MDLRFTANKYGPYAERLRHLLDALDGSYLHCEKRLSDAGPFDTIWFEDSKCEIVRDYLETDEARDYLPPLERTAAIIDGFEAPLCMELLATVDWLISQRGCERSVSGLREGLSSWPGGPTAARRKQAIFDDRMLGLALERLMRVAPSTATRR